ncbi:MAG: trimethylamine methyltransferase family protein [Proteobacteria bacterium]|nr:trimethylamine methyltransferase family protein [Pseudomonadota bacterium]MBI3497233.1 trimethylamine methyltransferase family protein [Pseudomonadota bacterium]
MSADQPSSETPAGPGRRDRPRRRPDRTAERSSGFQQPAWRAVVNPYRPIEVLSADAIESIHDASLQVLEELGMDFLSDEALALLKAAGAEVTQGSKRVRFDRGLILEKLKTVPPSFTLHARDPGRSLVFGDNHINFATVASAPYAMDLDQGRRNGNYPDYCNFIRLAQSLNIVHLIGGYPVEPIDLPPDTRHLDCYYANITLSDRVWHPYALGRQRILDAIEMLAIGRGVSKDALQREPGLFTVVNTSSPLRVDGPMLDGLTEMALAGQAIAVTPFTLAGAMAPLTLAGALTQQNAEALAVIAFSQIVRPGTPILYGGFTSNVDMKSGAPAFGTPEYAKAALAGGQLARRYRIPYRSSNANAANTPDAQAAWESMMSVWAAFMGHANLMLHGAGWLQGGLCASFEKMMMDAELLQMMASFAEPIEVSEATLAVDAMREVGPGGHFFGAAHTLARYETAFYAPILADWSNYESWREAGSRTALERANALWKRLLAEYRQPSLDPAIGEALKDYMARRKAAKA